MLARRIVVALGVLSISSFAAMAADMPVKAPIVKAPAVMPFNWTGFYVGGNVGYGWGNGDTSFTPLPTATTFINLAPTTLSPDPSGVVGGVQRGRPNLSIFMSTLAPSRRP
jgi:outer membrane immunogenic protein